MKGYPVYAITCDNSKEFAVYNEIIQVLGAEIYFTHPCVSWERGTSENTNGLMRQYIPRDKGTQTLTDVSIYDIRIAIISSRHFICVFPHN